MCRKPDMISAASSLGRTDMLPTGDVSHLGIENTSNGFVNVAMYYDATRRNAQIARLLAQVETEALPKGLDETTIRQISAKKSEPAFLLDFRLVPRRLRFLLFVQLSLVSKRARHLRMLGGLFRLIQPRKRDGLCRWIYKH